MFFKTELESTHINDDKNNLLNQVDERNTDENWQYLDSGYSVSDKSKEVYFNNEMLGNQINRSPLTKINVTIP